MISKEQQSVLNKASEIPLWEELELIEIKQKAMINRKANGWVATSSIYNKRFIDKTELESIIKATEYIAKEKGLI